MTDQKKDALKYLADCAERFQNAVAALGEKAPYNNMTWFEAPIVNAPTAEIGEEAQARWFELNQRGIALKEAIENTRAQPVADDEGEISDGYHTFNELYEHRHALFMAVAKAYPHLAWKSPRHDDDTMMEGWFIAGISTPEGHATYHLPVRLYEAFPAAELDRAPKWDGHTSDDVLKRIAALRQPPAADNRGVDVDKLANEIRRLDGNNDMGAGELAEKLMPFIFRTTPEDEKGVILGYLHEVTEPNGQYHKMYSAQEESPWKHWKEDHQAGCRYKRTELFGAAPQPEHDKGGG